MERESGKRNINNNNSSSSNYINHNQQRQQNRERIGHGLGIGDTFRTRSSSTSDTPPPPPLTTSSSSPDFVLQWGNKKRLRCMKFQTKPDSSDPAHRTTARVDRRVITIDNRRTASPPPPHRVLRNSDNMRVSSQGHGTNGVAEHVKLHTQEGKRATPASANNHHHHHPHNNSNDVTFEMAHEEGNKKSGGGSSSGSEVIPPAVWPPKFVIALTNKEKEEDFMAIKGSKLPQRPKKRSKYVQRNLKLVSPGAWLCDLTLERYEVREKKTSKKRPRGLKAMCSTSMDSDSE
ncbi:hypothetical protein QQ045_015857 [Rhodiola kirilowii]